MKLSMPMCPECGEPAYGTVELIPGVAQLGYIDEEGVTDYEGETEVDWDGQESQNGDGGKPLVTCDNGHEWETDIDWGREQ